MMTSAKTINASRIQHRNNARIALRFAFDRDLINMVKEIPGRYWSTTLGCWHVPDNQETIKTLQTLGINTSALAAQTFSPAQINSLEVYTQYLSAQRYAPSTISTYRLCICQFYQWINLHHIPISEVTVDDIRRYNYEYFIVEKYSRSYQNQWINALKIFLQQETDLHINSNEIERPRKSTHLPEILSEQEVQALINSYKNIKHRLIIMMYYACGLRKSELIHLKIKNIDSKRMVIRIVNSKGAKDRDIALPMTLLPLLRSYYQKYKPSEYLFNGHNRPKYSASSIDKLLKAGLKRAGINKKITIHGLRHSYATHLVERNINLRYIQEALGHKSSKTTEIYTKLSKEQIGKMVSPLDLWYNDIKKNNDP